MYERILLAYDGSLSGRHALLEGAKLGRALRSELHLLAVMNPVILSPYAGGVMVEGFPTEVLVDQEREHFQHVLDEGISLLTKEGLVATGSLACGEPVQKISEKARDIKANLVCVGHRRAVSFAQRWWRNSTGAHLVDQAPCSVLIVLID